MLRAKESTSLVHPKYFNTTIDGKSVELVQPVSTNKTNMLGIRVETGHGLGNLRGPGGPREVTGHNNLGGL